jgi:hypothetical protein
MARHEIIARNVIVFLCMVFGVRGLNKTLSKWKKLLMSTEFSLYIKKLLLLK